MSQEDRGRCIAFSIWRTGGTTEHLGGIFATQRLIDGCHISPCQRVLDIGCGTGFTACYLAKKYQARVVAVDISPTSTLQAHRRIAREQLGDRVTVLRADAHQLPCASNSFDIVVIESVLAFCQAETVVKEAYRVLRTGGTFGGNELALIGTPPYELRTLLVETLGVQAFSAADWRSLFERAGFTEIISTARKMSFLEQIVSHVRVDGIVGYFTALVKGLGERQIRSVFLNKEMLRAARLFPPYIGYHLYVGRK